jgi:hypothetical protein
MQRPNFFLELLVIQRPIPIIPSNDGLCVLWNDRAEEMRLTCREKGIKLAKIIFGKDCKKKYIGLKLSHKTTHVLKL